MVKIFQRKYIDFIPWMGGENKNAKFTKIRSHSLPKTARTRKRRNSKQTHV